MSDVKSRILAKEISKLMKRSKSKNIICSINGYSNRCDFNLLKIKELNKELREGVKNG